MALDQKALQKERAKREAKRKQAKQGSSGLLGALSGAREWVSATKAPVADVFVPTHLFETGIGTVWLSRELADGRYAAAGILIDVYCLGAKNALHKIFERSEYPEVIASVLAGPDQEFERQHPACARKLVEGAVAYARDLGFEPHPDYRLAQMIFGDIDPSACPVKFTFGRDGKPLYMKGPNETPAMQRRILSQLERRCGPGGFDYYIEVH